LISDPRRERLTSERVDAVFESDEVEPSCHRVHVPLGHFCERGAGRGGAHVVCV
jgi:hypothetical protein